MPTRRAVLAGLAPAAGVVLLAGCGIRLEDDAPRIPLLPTREPVPDEPVLLVALARAEARAASAASSGAQAGSVTALAGERATAQATTLRSLLGRRGVPVPAATTGTATGAATSAPTGTAADPTATAADPAAERLGDLTLAPTAAQLDRLADVTATNRALVGSLDVDQAVTALLLGTKTEWPDASPPQGSAAVAPLRAARATQYALQVAAAQSTDAGRAALVPARALVDGWTSLLQTAAGAEAPPPPLGYALPFAVTTPAAARRLAAQVLTDPLPSLVGGLPAAAGASQVTWLVRAATQAEQHAAAFGAELAAFPGMSA